MLYGIENEIRVGNCIIRKPSKHAENQYTLISTDDGRFFAFFKDGQDEHRVSRIPEEIYMEMLQQAREDEAYLRWNRRHRDDGADVDTISDKSADPQCRSVEDSAIASVLLDEDSPIRNGVTERQWRRLELHFGIGLTLDEIAELEGCTKMGVKNTIEKALKNLKKNL